MASEYLKWDRLKEAERSKLHWLEGGREPRPELAHAHALLTQRMRHSARRGVLLCRSAQTEEAVKEADK